MLAVFCHDTVTLQYSFCILYFIFPADYLLSCPHDQTVGLGENATFFCELEQAYYDDLGLEIDWIIIVNGTVYNLQEGNLAELEELNFTLGTTSGYSLSLEVVATVANNNTQIGCRIQHLPNPPFIAFIEATLTVVGKSP